jgi:uncharacterized Zn-finger protein
MSMLQAKPGCTTQVQMISKADLPLSCPTQHERVWDAHPRVYLPVEAQGEVTCPYCDTKYVLQD